MMARAVLSDRAESRAASQSPSVAYASMVNTDRPDVSCREVSPGWNAASFRRTFPERWAQYLRETCRTAYGVQKAFPGIDSHTARDWISGKRDPKGSFVASAIARDPDAIKILGGLE